MFNNNTLLIDNIEIKIDSHFAELDGFRVLHLSDLHLSGSNNHFDNLFAKLTKIECELIIVSGDLIDDDSGIEACINYLSVLRTIYGIFVTYGNHDKYFAGLKEFIFFPVLKKFKHNNITLLTSKLQEGKVVVLDNKITHLYIKGIQIGLIGVDCPLGYDRFNDGNRFKHEIDEVQRLVDKADKDNYNILITHVPDLIQEIDTHSINLILSGHTHGGQIRLPLIGPLLVYSSFQKKYNMGLFKYNSSYLHVSSGLGATCTTPIRFRCPPRATLMTLKTS